MDRTEHTERMRETARICTPVIRGAYDDLCQRSSFLRLPLSRFVNLRSHDNQPLLRPYLVRLAYEVSGGRDWPRIAAACAASEVFNISTYQANIALDGKLDVATQKDRASQFACSMVSLQLAADLLRRVDADSKVIERLLSDLLAVNADLYQGQILDINVLTIERISDMTDIAAIHDLYLQRCRLLGGELTRWCFSTGASLGGGSDGGQDILEQIGLLMGTAGQIVNDVGDLVEIPGTHGNGRYQPLFSDLANGKATFPIINALERDIGAIRDLAVRASRGKGGLDGFRQCSRLLEDKGCFDATRECTRRFRQEILNSIKRLPPSIHRNYLALASSTLVYNKYFTVLRLRRGGR